MSSQLSRENLYLQVDFRRDDLPDVVSLYGDIMDGLLTRDREHWGIYTREFVRKSKEWQHSIDQVVEESQRGTPIVASVMDGLHAVAFRRGLGVPMYPTVSGLDLDSVLKFSIESVQKYPVSLVGYGVDFDDLANASQYYFGKFKLASGDAVVPKSEYFGGEYFAPADNSVQSVDYALAFHGSSKHHSDYFTALVLKNLLGSTSPKVRLEHGVTNHTQLGKLVKAGSVSAEAFSLNYSDSGLFGVYFSGASAQPVNESVKAVVAALKSIASGQIEGGSDSVQRAVSCAKAELASTLETSSRSEKIIAYHNQLSSLQKLHPTAELLQKFDGVDAKKVSAFAGKLLKSKPSVSTAGDPFAAAHIDEIGL